MLNDRRVKNHKLFEGVSPSFYDLVTCVRHPKNAHGVSKSDFLRIHQDYLSKKFGVSNGLAMARSQQAVAQMSSPSVLSRFLIHLRLAPGDAKTRPSGSNSWHR